MPERHESKAAWLVRQTLQVRQHGKDAGYVKRLAESYGGSFVGPDVTSDLADLELAAVLRVVELTGSDFESVIAQLDQPGVIRASDHAVITGPIAA